MLFRIDRRTSVPLHHQLRVALEKEILAGRWGPGDMVPTELELCEQLSVSRATVRRAILDLVQQGLLVRLPAKGTFVAERRSSRNTIVIAAFSIPHSPERASEFFFRIWGEMESTAQEDGLQVVVRRSNEVGPETAEFLDQLSDDPQTLGVAVFTWDAVDWEYVRRLHDTGFPYVLLNRYIPGREVPAVTLDDHGAVFDAVRRLYDIGHRRIAFARLKKSGTSTAHDDRVRGYLDAMERCGLQETANVIPLDGPDAIGAKKITEWLRAPNRPTALVVPNGYLAAEYAVQTELIGLRVPDDLSIIGFEDSSRVVDHIPGISTIDYAAAKIGKTAVDLINRQAAGDMSARTRHVIRSGFIDRGSCARLNDAKQALP